MRGCLFTVTAVVIVVLFVLYDSDRGGGGRTPGTPATPSITTAIDVSIRPSLLDSSTGVLRLKNLTGQSLGVSLSMHNKDSNQKKSHSITLQPHQTVEIGILEAGWLFAPNETVTISCVGYKNVTYNFFKTDKGTVGIKEAWW